MSSIRIDFAGIGFQVEARESVLGALKLFGEEQQRVFPDVHIVFTAVPGKGLDPNPPSPLPELPGSFLFPPFVGSGIQTLPLMLSTDHRIELSDILSRNEDPFKVPLLGVPEVVRRIRECSDHSSEVQLILHTLTVEIRDFREHRIDVFYVEEMEQLLSSKLAHESHRRTISMFLPDFGSLMVHSSAINRNGKVALFLAPDEGGKSTAVNLSPEGMVLSDDRNILKCRPEGVEVFSTPWGQRCNLGLSAPLGGIFLLKKADSFSLEPINPREAVRFLWEDNRPFWENLPKPRRTLALEILIEASRAVPVHRLCFAKDWIDWAAIDSVTGD